MIKTPLQSLSTGLILLMFLTVLSCNEAPFEPPPNGPEGYGVYFQSEGEEGKWYIYYPESNYLDSVELPTVLGWRTAISPSGNRLYLTRNAGYGLLVINLETEELITELSWNVRYIDLSPDGNMLAVGHNGFSLVNTTDWSVPFNDSVYPLTMVTFSTDGNNLLGADGQTYGWASIADPAMVTEEIVSAGFGLASGGRVLTSPLSDHWYLYSWPFIFIDWDSQADSAVFIDTARSSTGFYAHHITQDGRYVSYLDRHYTTGLYTELKVYSTELQQLVATVDTKFPAEDGDTTFFQVTEMITTPDSKWLIGVSHATDDIFLVYNLEELKIERYVEIPGTTGFINLACQTGE